MSFQTGFDIPEAFPVSELGETRYMEMFAAGKFPYFLVAVVYSNAFIKLIVRKDRMTLVEQIRLSLRSYLTFHGKYG